MKNRYFIWLCLLFSGLKMCASAASCRQRDCVKSNNFLGIVLRRVVGIALPEASDDSAASTPHLPSASSEMQELMMQEPKGNRLDSRFVAVNADAETAHQRILHGAWNRAVVEQEAEKFARQQSSEILQKCVKPEQQKSAFSSYSQQSIVDSKRQLSALREEKCRSDRREAKTGGRSDGK